MPHGSTSLARPRTPLLTLACLAGTLLAVTLGLGPAQPEPASLDPVIKRIDAVEARLTAVNTGLEDGRKEVRSVRDEVAQLRSEVSSLRADVAEIKSMLATLVRPAGPAGPAPLEVPADPFASQDAMAAALRARYQKAFGEAPAGGEAGRRERLREVERWVRDTNRDMRGKGRWVVRLEKVVEVPANPESGTRGDGTGYLATYTVLNAMTRKAVSTAQTHKIPGHLGKRLEGVPAGTLAEVGVFLSSEMVFSPERAETGIFGVPVLIGPFVEQGLKTEWLSVELVKDSVRPARPEGDPPR